MLNVIKEKKDDILIVRLAGSIDENTDFAQLLGEAPKELHVYCKEVPRINSTGVKAWIKYFQAQTTKGSKVKFFECSPALVQQINLIVNFIAGGEVVSIAIPYSCSQCHAELMGIKMVEELQKAEFEIPEQPCIKCGGKADFDDIESEYFGFLMRQ